MEGTLNPKTTSSTVGIYWKYNIHNKKAILRNYFVNYICNNFYWEINILHEFYKRCWLCGPTLPWGLLSVIGCWGVGVIFFIVIAPGKLPLLWDVTHTMIRQETNMVTCWEGCQWEKEMSGENDWRTLFKCTNLPNNQNIRKCEKRQN